MKPGRNDACPCGSGKKYKHCCLTDSLESPADLTWRRVRRALDDFKIGATIVRFVGDAYGPVTLDEAWEEFMVWPDEADSPPLDMHSPHIGLFMSWLFHVWTPDPHRTGVENAALHDRRPTAVYLEQHERVDPVVRRYLEACLASPFSFHEVMSCEPGRGFRARNILTGEELEVVERGASQTLQKHDIIFGQLVPIDGIVMLESCSPFGLAPDRKLPILDMRDAIRKHRRRRHITAKELRDYDIELRELYLSIAQQVLEPSLPKLQNTDGEPLVPQRVIFEIDSAELAFEALKHLAQGESMADLASTIERDARGEMRHAEIPWVKKGNAKQKSWKNTVLGVVRIEGKRLAVEVNSVTRASRIRALIEGALGEHARYRAASRPRRPHASRSSTKSRGPGARGGAPR